MGGVSTAASLVAVTQITIYIASILRDYYSSVRDARSDILQLYNSIKSLQATLNAMRDDKIWNKDKVRVSELLAHPNGPLQIVWVELKTLG